MTSKKVLTPKPRATRLVLFRLRDTDATSIVVGAFHIPSGNFIGDSSPAAKMIEATINSQSAYFTYIKRDHFRDMSWLQDVLAMCGDEFSAEDWRGVRDEGHFNAVADAVVGKRHSNSWIESRYGLD